MAVTAIKATLGPSLGDGRFSAQAVSRNAGPYTAATTADTEVAASQALEAAVTSAVSDAEANGVISGDPTALGLVQAIQTAFDLLIAQNVVAKAATAAAKTAVTGDAVLAVDLAVVDTRNKLNAVLKAVSGAGNSSGQFTDA